MVGQYVNSYNNTTSVSSSFYSQPNVLHSISPIKFSDFHTDTCLLSYIVSSCQLGLEQGIYKVYFPNQTRLET